MAILSKSNLYNQGNPNQNSNDIPYRDLKIHIKVHIEAQKSTDSQGNTAQKEQCWRYHKT
jgi:hypothetical protein